MKELTFRAPTGPNWAGTQAAGPAEALEARRRQAGPLPCLALREALIEPELTNAYRVIHGASDGWPGWYVERLGEFLLSHSAQALSPGQREELGRLATVLFGARGLPQDPDAPGAPHRPGRSFAATGAGRSGTGAIHGS